MPMSLSKQPRVLYQTFECLLRMPIVLGSEAPATFLVLKGWGVEFKLSNTNRDRQLPYGAPYIASRFSICAHCHSISFSSQIAS